jgi:predicted lipoprotein with Yx(FWY)xxD motif
MKRTNMLAAALGLVALFVLPATAMDHEVKIAEKAGIGHYLTDAGGMTLYWFGKDSVGHSACADACVGNWPVFYRAQVAPPDGVSADDFGIITREDGTEQTSFRGYPLYYYTGDAAPGDTNGNDMMDLWHVVDPDNFPSG